MINYILGSVEICIDSLKAISCLTNSNVRCSRIKSINERIYFEISLYNIEKVKKILTDEGFFYKIIKYKGLPKLFFKLYKRIGILVGITIFLVLVYYSSRHIWSIDVIGNSVVTDEEIICMLESLGCGVGSKIDDIDFDELHNRFLIECKDISWISVNMDGVKANVEVKEVKRGKKEHTGNANIVASEDGQIELITLIKGKTQVEIGDVVKSGDILISGVESYREGENTFYRNADGCVMAKVNRIIKAQVNEKKNLKTKTGNYEKRISLKIFNLNINLFGKGGNRYEECDIITENRQLVLFGVVELPVWINTESIYEVNNEIVKLSEDELEAEAIKVYKSLLYEASKDSELISISTKRFLENGIYTIESNIYCITDIAERVPYEIISEDQKED